MYCKNCGKEIDEKAVICPYCGVPVHDEVEYANRNIVDNGGFGWGILGCCIPVVGLILFLVWKDTKPKTSKAAGIGALVGVGAIILIYVCIFMFAMLGAMTAESYYYY